VTPDLIGRLTTADQPFGPVNQATQSRGQWWLPMDARGLPLVYLVKKRQPSQDRSHAGGQRLLCAE
jgi:hypothetical protein